MPETKELKGVSFDASVDILRGALAGLSFGNLVLTVHEGRLVQIDVTTRKRFKPS